MLFTFKKSWAFSCLLAVCGLFAAASWNVEAATLQKKVINGYEVYFINTGMGNGAALTVNVQSGSLLDEPVHDAGKSHLFEHIIHGGSEEYPGQDTLWKRITEFGSTYNAYTADAQIFYYHYLHPDAIDRALPLLGATLTRPEFSPTTFLKEREIVKNEAAKYAEDEARALDSMPFIHLLSKDHPFRMYTVGTQEQLNAMTLDDVKRLYYTNYIPGSMQIIIVGNFNPLPNGEIPLEMGKLEDLIAKSFKPQKTDHPYTDRPAKEKHIPGFDSAGSKVLHVKSNKDTSQLILKAEVVGDPSIESLEVALDFLNSDEVGSVKSALRQKGWISDAGFFPREVNNLRWVEMHFILTPEGLAHYQDLAKFTFSSLGRLGSASIDEKTFEYLIQKKINSYEGLAAHADETAEAFAKLLNRSPNRSQFSVDSDGSAEAALLNHRERFGKVTRDSVASAVSSLFRTDHLLVTLLSPTVDNAETSSIFGRQYAVVEDPAFFAELNHSIKTNLDLQSRPLSLDLPQFKVEQSTAPLEGPKAETKMRILAEEPGKFLFLKENHSSTNGAIILGLQNPLLSLKSKAAKMFAAEIFAERFAAELGHFRAVGAKISMGHSPLGGHSYVVEGNRAATKQALLWLLEETKNFQITADELERAKQGFLSAESTANDEFAASLAGDLAKSIVRSKAKPREAFAKTVAALDVDSVNKAIRYSFAANDIRLALNGDYDIGFAHDLLKQVEGLFPRRLTERTRNIQKESDFLLLKQSADFFKALQKNAIGQAWVFQGPEITSRNMAAMKMLSTAMHNQVFAINRIREELGYVHGFHGDISKNKSMFVFVGQTEGEDRFPRIEKGWREILGMLQDETLSPTRFESERRGISLKDKLLPRTLTDNLALDLRAYFQLGSLDAHEDYLRALKEVTPEEIYAMGREYLNVETQPKLNVIMAREKLKGVEACDNALHSIARVRRKLKQK